MLREATLPKEKIFDHKWWNDTFIGTTESLTKTSVFKECISKAETKEMREQILDIVRLLCELRTNQFGFRVFIEGKQLGQKEMNQIYDAPPKKKESLDSWANRVFEDKKFGMIINRGEKLNNDLAKKMAFKIDPLLKIVGTPLLGLNFTIFIGNYGWTPLGIHTDAPGESVTHFHLGPAGKTMYTWNNEEYEKLAGENKFNNKEIEKFLPYAKVHPFEEGDLYYMPPNEFHIGKSDELSIGLTLWFNNHQKTDLARKLLRVVLDQYMEENSDTMLPDKNDLESIESVEQAIDLYNIPNDIAALPFKDFLREIYKDYRYSLYSNSGYWTRPFPKEKEIKFTLNDKIILEKPFKIQYKESIDKNHLLVYVRGTKLVLNNFECIKNLIDEINTGQVLIVRDLFSNNLPEDWDENIGFYILNLIDTHHGIKKI